MGRQLRLDLERALPHRREDFIVSGGNASAIAALDGFPDGLTPVLALIGPEGSGKTHLAAAWAQKRNGLIRRPPLDAESLSGFAGRTLALDDAERCDGEALFHLINLADTEGGALLLTGRSRPAAWPADVPDLRSRLNALRVVEIRPPDDEALAALLGRYFATRSVRPSDDLIEYLVRRIERSAAEAKRVVERLDEAALATGRPLSRALAREILENDT